MTIIVRPATPEDAESIERLNADVQALHAAALPTLFKSPTAIALPAHDVRELMRAPAVRLLLAEADGEPAGYAYAEIRRRPENGFRFANDSVYLHQISVVPAQRGRGVGCALMDAVRAIAKSQGISQIELDVWTFNAKAREFFQRQGFVTFNERMWTR